MDGGRRMVMKEYIMEVADNGMVTKVGQELVRCKDCVNRYDPINCKMYSEGMDTSDEWFCADGERRTDGHQND